MIADQHVNNEINAPSLTTLFKLNTTTIHDNLDKTIMTKRPFASLDRYALFLEVQYRFHLAIAPLYSDTNLSRLVSDLPTRQRLSHLEQDLRDINLDLSEVTTSVNLVPVDYPASLGWLYVSEGSNLGAEYLLKAAKRIGLSEEFGASHLAPATIGRGQSWQDFTTALNTVELTKEQQTLAINGARDAFSLVRSAVDCVFV